MQQGLAQECIRVDLIDADGCLYHQGYQNLLAWLFVNCGEIFAALSEQRLAAKKLHLIDQGEITPTLQQIKTEMKAFNVSSLTENDVIELRQEIVRRSREREHKINPHKEFTDHDLYMRQMRHYLGILFALDQSFLQEVAQYANPELMRALSPRDGKNKLQYIGINSNRQSMSSDVWGMSNNLTGSVFQDVLHLTRELRRTHNQRKTITALLPLTMTDISARLPQGENYRRIISAPTSDHEDFICDASKLSVLYLMSHAAAVKHPNSKITVNFYENEPAIIDGLYNKLHEKPGSDMLPANVTAVLYPYNGKFGEARVITGTGPIDYDYAENTHYMHSLAQLSHARRAFGEVNVLQDVGISEFLEQRIAKHNDKTLAVMLDADGCIYNFKYFYLVINLILEFGKEMEKMAREFKGEEARAALRKKIKDYIKSIDIEKISKADYFKVINDLSFNADFSLQDYDLMQDDEQLELHPHVTLLRQYLRYLQKIDPHLGTKLLYQANKNIFSHIVERAKRDECGRIVFLVGSNRQCVTFDEHNSKTNGTNSYYADLRGLVDYLREKLAHDIHVDLDQFLTADLYGQLKPGESFKRSLSNPHRLAHPGAVFDDSKVSLIYAVSNYVSRHYPNNSGIEFYDDMQEIHAGIAAAYGTSDNHSMLPAVIDLIVHNGMQVEINPVFQIVGKGETDCDLQRTLKLMAEMSNANLAELHFGRAHINAANDLVLSQFAEQRKLKKPESLVEFDALTSVKPLPPFKIFNYGYTLFSSAASVVMQAVGESKLTAHG